MKNILVLCNGNSCRSQMAEGYLRFYAGKKVKIYSAGVETHGVSRRALVAMYEDGIDLRHHTSNHVDEYSHVEFDYVITVCDNAQERCPVIPVKAEKFHYNFPDPAKAEGSVEEVREHFRQVRNMIKTYCQDFVENHVAKES